MKALWQRLRDFSACLVRLRPHVRIGRYLLVGIVVTALISSVLEGVGVGLLLPLLDLLLHNEQQAPSKPIRLLQQWLPDHALGFYVGCFCALVLGAIVAKNLFLYASTALGGTLRRRVTVNLRDALFRRLQEADLDLFETGSPGGLTNLFYTEVVRTQMTLDFILLLGQRASLGVFYLCALFVVSWPLTLLTMASAAVVGGCIALFYRSIGRRGAEISKINNEMGARLTETYGGIRTIRATDSQAREINRFNEVSERLGRLEEKNVRVSSMLGPIAEVMAVAGAMLIVACAYFFLVQPGHMPSSHLMGYGFILLRLLPLVNQLYGIQGNVIYMSAGILAVEKWLQTPRYPRRPFGGTAFAAVQRSIRFEQVSFRYTSGKQALEGVDFEMPAGKTVALVGASGSGKTTIANLLLRFREPTGGRILVDGRDYWEFSPDSWHRAVAVVEQEAFLFHDTLEHNIAYGCPEATPEDVREAVRMANLAEVVEGKPDGLKTMIGERGVALSGGQRQRLAIARALVRHPKILILDEATSALDTLSERQVQAALDLAKSGRTVLVIAHRLSTVRHADNIVVLDGGRVVESGTWEDLMARDGAFTRLVNSVLAQPPAPAPAASDSAALSPL